jgi:hypothetical protein
MSLEYHAIIYKETIAFVTCADRNDILAIRNRPKCHLNEHTKCVQEKYKYKYLQHTVISVSYAKFYFIFVKMSANVLK